MYKLLRPILFLFNPEKIHKATMGLLTLLDKIPFCNALIRLFYNYNNPKLEREIFGVKFKNPVGLAGGFDKNGDKYNLLSNFGFGFIEIGTLTLKPQEGNPKPRCFRLTKDKAIINRMGINNLGVKHAVNYLKKHSPNCVIGASISKNSSTPINKAISDFEVAFEYLYDFVDYFSLNLSCPNVKDQSNLQSLDTLTEIIDSLLSIRRMYDEYRPILIKVSPDISKDQLDEIIDTILISGLDGIIATNTTKGRKQLKTSKKQIDRIGNGGLSGMPLYEMSLDFVKYIHKKTNGMLPIIACGGIMTPNQAQEMLNAGASLVQVYTGFIYNGPSFIKKINKHLISKEITK